MQYINFVFGTDGESVMHTAPVPADDAAFLDRAISTLRPLSEEDYTNGLAAVLKTGAHFSYVLWNENVYWCIEWDPGFIVVQFTPKGDMAWTAIRSPVPGFGGREATDAEWDEYDEDAPNPQYNLIFDPFDAQYDSQKCARKSFIPADAEIQDRFNCAIGRANELSELLESRFATEQEEDAWFEQCEQNLEEWCGEGIRLV